MTDLDNETCELSDADLEAVVAGSLNAAISIGGGCHPDHSIGSQSSGAGAGKVTFNPF
jgi:hypothetical protein